MIYLEAPNHLDDYTAIDLNRTIFLGGSITGASDWQAEMRASLGDHFNIFNPRRDRYDVGDSSAARPQIQWEHKHLELAKITLFYFAPETLAPITLLEYGKQLVKCRTEKRKTYVCVHPNYVRKLDVIVQTEIENPLALERLLIGEPRKMVEAVRADHGLTTT